MGAFVIAENAEGALSWRRCLFLFFVVFVFGDTEYKKKKNSSHAECMTLNRIVVKGGNNKNNKKTQRRLLFDSFSKKE